MAEDPEVIQLDPQNSVEDNPCPTPAINGWSEQEQAQHRDQHTDTLIIEDVTEKETAVLPRAEKKSRKTLVRVYLKRLRKMEAKVHPLDRPVSPQILIKDGKITVWTPDLKISDDVNDDVKLETHTLFSCCKTRNHHVKKNAFDFVFSEDIRRIEVGFGSGVASIFRFMRWVVLHNMMLFLVWTILLILPTAVSFDYTVLKGKSFSAENLLDGNGLLQHTWFFYGSYPAKKQNYRIDAAYVVVALLTYFGTLFMLLRSIAKTETPVRGSPFSLLLFTSCNFAVRTASDKDALLEDRSVQARDLLSEAQTKEEARNNTARKGQWTLFFSRLFAWLISLALTAAACATIYFFLTKVTVAKFIASKTNIKVGQDFLKSNGLSLVFSFLNAAFPAIITKLVKIESYTKVTTEIRVNVIRVFSLRFLSVIALMVTLYTSVTSDTFQGCGGTFIGQEFYKIIVFDILFVQTVRFTFKALLGLIKKEKKEPDIAALILQVAYRQALIWSGTFFCPILSLLGLASQTLVFYSNFILVAKFCKAPSKRFRNDGNTSFYKACMVVTLGILLIPAITVLGSQYVSIGIIKTATSFNTTCGPFKNQPPLDVLKELSDSKKSMPDWLYKIYNWLTSAAVFPALIVLCTIVYVQTVRLNKQKKSLKELQIDHHKFKMKTNARLVRVTTSM